jgi:hypothetical protein
MKFLVRQTYTTASLVAMIPAAIWSVSWYGDNSLVHSISRFPYVYLFICQLMLVPRYVGAAWLTVWFAHRYKKFNEFAGFFGFITVGIMLDIWLTFQFARAIALPPEGNHALLMPFFAIVYGLIAMTLGSLAGGFGFKYIKPYTKAHK